MKRIILFFIFGVAVILVYFLFITKGKGAYKSSGMLGYSKTKEESIRRNTFIKELSYKTKPDTLRINYGIKFFIEKGFRYGEWDSKVTDSLTKKDNFRYQLNIEFPNEKTIFKGAYITSSNNKIESNKFYVIPDTIKYNIITLSPPYDSIYKVGELLLFEK